MANVLPAPEVLRFLPANSTAVRFAWNAVNGADGYEVRGGGTEMIRSVSGTSALIRGLLPGVHVTMSVRATRGVQRSQWSSIEIRPTPRIPEDPTNYLIVPLIDADRQSIQLRLPNPHGDDVDCLLRVWWQPSDEGWWGSLEVPTNTPVVSSRSLPINAGLLDNVGGVLDGNIVMRATGQGEVINEQEPDRDSLRIGSHQLRWEPTSDEAARFDETILDDAVDETYVVPTPINPDTIPPSLSAVQELIVTKGTTSDPIRVSISKTPPGGLFTAYIRIKGDARITPSVPSISFGSNLPQTFTITAASEDVIADKTATLTLTNLDGSVVYRTIAITARSLVNIPPTPSVSSRYLLINEGSSSSVSVSLSHAYEEPFVVRLSTTGSSDVSTSTATLTFPAESTAPQSFTINVAHDADVTDEVASIALNNATNTITYDTISVTVTDDDSAVGTIQVLPTGTISLNEGATTNSTVRLSTQPHGDVTVSIASSNSDISATPSSLTFTNTNWNTAQAVAIRAAQDADASNESGTITFSASGGISAPNVSRTVSVTDDDSVGLTVSSTSFAINEGSTASANVRLATQPTSTVTVSATSADTGAVTVSPPSLTFTSANWDEDQAITMTAVQDADSTNESVTITLAASGGDYASVSRTITVGVTDDEGQTGLTLSLGDPDWASEVSGSPGAFRYHLTGETGTVTSTFNIPNEVREFPDVAWDSRPTSGTYRLTVTKAGDPVSRLRVVSSNSSFTTSNNLAWTTGNSVTVNFSDAEFTEYPYAWFQFDTDGENAAQSPITVTVAAV